MKSLYEAEGRKAWVDLGKGISILLVVLFRYKNQKPHLHLLKNFYL